MDKIEEKLGEDACEKLGIPKNQRTLVMVISTMVEYIQELEDRIEVLEGMVCP